MPEIALTGIKPTGSPHLGNYLGMIRPALALSRRFRAFYFIADYHALTGRNDPHEIRRRTYEIAAAWIALGLDPRRVVFYRQSDVPEIFEFTWILQCVTPKGLLNRAHAYKAAVDANLAAGRDPDADINAGLYSYPVLMAADILMCRATVVPVGLDQKQHLEITRDIAAAFNRRFGDTLHQPEAWIETSVETIPGLDGRKMSKNYNNTIPIFAEPDLIRRRVMGIVTDSRTVDAPKDPEHCNVFSIYRHFASSEQAENMRRKYRQGAIGYGAAKEQLRQRLEETFGAARSTYQELLADRNRIDRILKRGAAQVRPIAAATLQIVREKLGARVKASSRDANGP
jgi:tryptophanyl-tRNA synthetase